MAPSTKSEKPGPPSRRAEIVAATRALIGERGLANVTTRLIAKAAGCSEAAIYVHFAGRAELLLAVFRESLPEMSTPFRALEDAVGARTPQRNLLAALSGLHHFHQQVVPMLAALFAEPDLLAEYRKLLLEGGKGPQGAIDRLARYLAAERELGRIDRGVDPQNAATALIAGVFFLVFTSGLLGTERQPFAPRARRLIAQTLRT